MKMQNYQQYLSLPTHHQLPPLAPYNHRPSPLLGRGDIPAGGLTGTYTLPAPGHLSIKPPLSLVYQIQSDSITYGFNSSGSLIGANQELTYQSPKSHYYELPLSQSPDWYTTSVLGDASLNEVLKKRETCPRQSEVSVKQAETAEYFTAANDEGYEQWIAKKIQQQQNKAEQEVEERHVPKKIRTLLGHANPSTTETANEVYGQYLDLRPKFPAVYPLPEKLQPMSMPILVKFRHSNMSDHKLIPDHSFAVDPREMMKKHGPYARGIYGAVYLPQGSEPQTKTAFSFRQNEVILGYPLEERTHGATWPLYSPTGLELNRPFSRGTVSVVASLDGKKRVKTLVPARAVPYIYSRYMSYSARPGQDRQTETNPARFPHKLLCSPFAANSHSNPTCDPCSVSFINPQILPVPAEIRKPSCC